MISIENVAKLLLCAIRARLKSRSFGVRRRLLLRVMCGVGRSIGAGKSELMRTIYGNYLLASGKIMNGDKDMYMVVATPLEIIQLRRHTLGHVSKNLRVVPRGSTLHVVADPLCATGKERAQTRTTIQHLLARLYIPERLWLLNPATFPSGEQERIIIARGLASPHRAFLPDEPIPSPDRAAMPDMIKKAKERGAAIIGIFHDHGARDAVCDRQLDISQSMSGLAA